jgi:hypothetical protein
MNYLLMTIYLAFHLIFVVDYLRAHYDPLNSLFKSRLSFNCILRIFELKCASQVCFLQIRTFYLFTIVSNSDCLSDILVSNIVIWRNKSIFRPPNLGNIALPYTLGQGRCDFPYNVKNF